MGMAKEHTQDIADNIAIEEYGHLFCELPKSIQDNIFNKALEIADNQIKELTR